MADKTFISGEEVALRLDDLGFPAPVNGLRRPRWRRAEVERWKAALRDPAPASDTPPPDINRRAVMRRHARTP